jgi:hypothetical protein
MPSGYDPTGVQRFSEEIMLNQKPCGDEQSLSARCQHRFSTVVFRLGPRHYGLRQ